MTTDNLAEKIAQLRIDLYDANRDVDKLTIANVELSKENERLARCLRAESQMTNERDTKIIELRMLLRELLRTSDMRRAWDTLTQEEFDESYPEEGNGGYAFGDVDELWVKAKDAARAALSLSPIAD